MALIQFNYRSQALGMYVNISVTYPTDKLSYYDTSAELRNRNLPDTELKPSPMYRPGMKFQTIYLIHGGGDENSLTYRYTNAERYAQEHNVMLVTPGIPNSFGIDTAYGVGNFTFLTEELPVVIQSLFASSPAREDNFVMGYAMGGNVALGMAVRRPDLYAACVDLSGGIGMTLNTAKLQAELANHHFPLYSYAFGDADKLPGSPNDLYPQAVAHLASGKPQPRFWLVAGSEEGFIGERVKNDAITMKQLGYDVDFIEVPSMRHDFDLWDLYIRKGMELLPLRGEPLYPAE